MKIEAVIFGCGRTLYNPETNELFSGTIQTLKELDQKGKKKVCCRWQ